jgi:2-oxoglutarate dehydrogenase E1 component
VDPVLLGQTRATQILKNDVEKKRVLPLLIHGDAALAGQGVVYESMQLMRLADYSVGGTIHLVLNNQIGYTTLPKEGRSTRYCTDIAKTFGVPVFHVNAEDPESCLFAAKIAIEIRQKFQCDVFLDLLGYRKYGHNEGDEPSYTQPVQYRLIRSKKSIRQIYCDQLIKNGQLEQKVAETLEADFKETLRAASAEAATKEKGKGPTEPPPFDPFQSLDTGVDQRVLKAILEKFCLVPEGFHLHPKLQKWLQDRSKMWDRNIDWSTAECLAFGSLLLEKIPLRLAGQDSRRGTFSQRHMVWSDTENGALYYPLSSLGQGRFDIVNSPLTEYAGLGFEYGYSCGSSQGLVLWEAQYGDFDNGAQIIIDQYIASAEQKWNVTASLVLLLPHGYEGAGPEHSSARLERFLQLCARNNMQIANASTPAQYFHLLRRQALRRVKKPLIIFTPKSLLRASANVSPSSAFLRGNFEEILDDPKEFNAPPHRLLFCSGKIYYDLMLEREKRNLQIPIVRIEQLYPLHMEKLQKTIDKYKGVKEIFWVQEEPENMGAWTFLAPRFASFLSKGVTFKQLSRPPNSTPATGSHMKHKQEQMLLVEAALGESQ